MLRGAATQKRGLAPRPRFLDDGASLLAAHLHVPLIPSVGIENTGDFVASDVIRSALRMVLGAETEDELRKGLN